MNNAAASLEFPYTSNYVEVLGSKIHYIEQGTGNPILFLHGIPTSSYMWRNVMPYLGKLGRCIAPDLIGFGKSDKPNIEYSIADHILYIEKFIEALKLNRITIVMHGWGSIIGFDYAMRNERKCRGLAFYESYLRPLNGECISLPYQEHISKWEGCENIRELMANGIRYVDEALSIGALRGLSEDEIVSYREPFQAPGSEKPLCQYLQNLPGSKQKNNVDQVIEAYSKKLTQSSLPKLMLYSVPGFITTISTVMWAKEHLPHLELVDIGEDLHYAQERSLRLMGETISVWLQGIEKNHS